VSEIIRFSTNVPEEVALRFPTGKEVEGRYGMQIMYSLADERTMYVPPIVADRIRELQIRPGERFNLCKREKAKGKGIEWVIERVDPPGVPGAPIAPAPPASAPRNGRTPSTANTTQNGQPNHNGNCPAPASNGNVMAELIRTNTAIATGVLCAAIDALMNAERYAASKGIKYGFNEEDVRALANTLFIQASRSATCTH
jgi:hypothetical protein